MKSLLIEKTAIGSIECEAIMLNDLTNKKCYYIYAHEKNYQDWVIEQANLFRESGYKIFNSTDIQLN